MAARTHQNANQDELDLWMPDSKSCDAGGKMRQMSARRVRCPNRSASGNHLGQNGPRPREADASVPCSRLGWAHKVSRLDKLFQQIHQQSHRAAK